MNNISKVIVSPCPEGFAITKFGDGALTVQPTYAKDWKRGDIRKSLKILYPKATVVFYDKPVEVVIEPAFGVNWVELRTKK